MSNKVEIKTKPHRGRTGKTGARLETLEANQTQNATTQVGWPDLIPADQWAIYRRAMEAVHSAGIRFLVGGGFALAAYMGRWRNTKDIDFYVMPHERQAIIDVLTEAGFGDFYPQLPYDRGWIYRSTRDGVIVDVIWSMANRRAEVDEIWFQRALPTTIRDESFGVVPAEELLWCKLYVFQRDHCDWSDVFNLLYAVGPKLNWAHVLKRLGSDVPLLKGALTMFSWISPTRASEFPPGLWQWMELPQPIAAPAEEERWRRHLLDSRAWFAGVHPIHLPLEV